MRKRLILAALAAAAGVCLASCEKEGFEIQSPSVEVAGETVLRASLDDESTKTFLSMNGAGTHADVLWEAGDQIELAYLSGNSYGYLALTTQDGGSTEADFQTSQYDFGTYSPFVAVYPSTMFQGLGFYNGLGLAISIPTSQQAVAGGLQRGMLGSVAYTEDISDGKLQFKNMYALLKFRLDGSNAGQVKKVRFSAGTNIAGDCIYYPETRTYDMNAWYTTNYGGPQSYVELTGSFEAGADYYVAMAPGTTYGFSMQFFNSSDEPITKISDKTLTLNRARITDFGTITLNEDFGGLPAGVEQYMTHTKGTKPVCIAVIAEAFKADEQDVFTVRARQAVDALFATEPYKTYRDYFNVYIMHAVSNDSGASKTDGKGNITELHDTYFSSRWGADSYDDMDSNSTKAFKFVAARCPEIYSGLVPSENVPILMLINDTRYGGICWNWGNGACLGHVPYTYDGASMGWSHPSTMASGNEPGSAVTATPQSVYDECGTSIGDWRNVVVHEFGGHGFGRFNDEYWYGNVAASSSTVSGHSWTVPMGLNVSGSYDSVPWQTEVLDEIESRRALSAENPNPYDIYAARVGKYQGGDICTTGRWRSERISCMIDNRQYFSCWQRMLIVKRIMSLAGETFDLDDFYANDVAVDPVRDGKKNAAPAWGRIPEKPQVRMCPPLPPPVLKETPAPIPF